MAPAPAGRTINACKVQQGLLTDLSPTFAGPQPEMLMLRPLTVLACVAAAAALAACVHDERPSVTEAARSACVAEHSPDEQMGACVRRMSENIEAARAYQPTPPHRPRPAATQTRRSRSSSTPHQASEPMG